MKYSIYIDQTKSQEWGLSLTQAILFSVIYELPSWANSRVFDGEILYLFTQKKLREEVPVLQLKDRALKKALSDLESKGLIERLIVHESNRDHRYIRTTEKGKSWGRWQRESKENTGQDAPHAPECTGGMHSDAPHAPECTGSMHSDARGYAAECTLLINQDQITNNNKKIPPLPPLVAQNKNNSQIVQARADVPQIDQFSRFWQAYPKKRSKGQAEKAFKKINPSEQLLATMIAKIEQAKTSHQWQQQGGQFIPYPATWLNAKGWEDEIDMRLPEPERTDKLQRARDALRDFHQKCEALSQAQRSEWNE